MITIEGKPATLDDIRRLDAALHRVVLAMARHGRLKRQTERAAERVRARVEQFNQVKAGYVPLQPG